MIKGKIDSRGRLWIWRVSRWKKQRCRFVGHHPDNKMYPCSDDCSHFKEPTVRDGEPTHIHLCHAKTWVFDEFTDERVGLEEETIKGLQDAYREQGRVFDGHICKGHEA